MRTKLILVEGIPGSGKSTIAKTGPFERCKNDYEKAMPILMEKMRGTYLSNMTSIYLLL